MIIPKNKPYVHLIGQDKDKTIIHLNLNVGSKLTGKEIGGKTAYWEHSVHNPSSPVYKYEIVLPFIIVSSVLFKILG